MNHRNCPAFAGLGMSWLAVIVSVAALGGCNKKAEDCRLLGTTNREALMQKVDVDIADDKFVEKKSEKLGDFLKTASSIQNTLGNAAMKDVDVGTAVSSYSDALAVAVARASELKTVFDEVGGTTKSLERRLALRTASKGAISELLVYAPSPNERTRIGRQVDSYASSPPEQRLSAIISFVGSLKPTPLTDAAIKAFKDEMEDLKASGELEKKFGELEKRSDVGRSAFAAARTSLRQSDSQLTRICKLER